MAVYNVLSKKGKVVLIIAVVLGIITVGGSCYLLWRINQEEKLSSEESEAGANVPATGGGNYCCRFKCCDGSWRALNCTNDQSKAGPNLCVGVNKDNACGSSKYSNCAGVAVVKCTCEKWSDSCGVNCTFPSGTQEKVNAAAAADCADKIAMCNISTGSVTIETYGPKHGCYGKISQCKNPFASNPCKTNTCEGGGWIKKPSSSVKYGEIIEISGYGKDSDGIDPNSIVVKLDGEDVGKVDANVDSLDKTKTNWAYKFSNLSTGTHSVVITWKDMKNTGGSNCSVASTFSVLQQNVCEGGGWTKKPSSIIKFGEPVEMSGYGKDADGVDPTTVILTINGEEVDDVNVSVDETDKTKTIWSYTATGLKEGNYTLFVSWKDLKGVGGADCMLTTAFTVLRAGELWQIDKVGSPICIEGSTDNLDKVQISYLITITNLGSDTAVLEKIVDNLDSKTQRSFLMSDSITGGGIYSDGSIIWDLQDEQMSYSSGESKIYQYSLLIPRSSFGSYLNTVVAITKEGNTFSDSSTIQASCNLAQTGILDNSVKKVLLGWLFLIIGILNIRFDFLNLIFSSLENEEMKIARIKEEYKANKVTRKRKKYEKQIKAKNKFFGK